MTSIYVVWLYNPRPWATPHDVIITKWKNADAYPQTNQNFVQEERNKTDIQLCFNRSSTHNLLGFIRPHPVGILLGSLSRKCHLKDLKCNFDRRTKAEETSFQFSLNYELLLKQRRCISILSLFMYRVLVYLSVYICIPLLSY